MAAHPLIRMYLPFQSATETVRGLEAAGVLRSDISILAHYTVDRGTNGMTPDRLVLTETDGNTRVGAGSAADTASGAGPDLVAELVVLTSPNVGPIVVDSWLASPLTARLIASARGLVGALTACAINERRARLFANGVRGGASLVAVRCNDVHHASSHSIMRAHNPIDPEVYDLAQRYGGRWVL